MQRQLRLIEATDKDWRLDPVTKDLGIRGVQNARAALRAARPIDMEIGSSFGDALFDADIYDATLDAA